MDMIRVDQSSRIDNPIYRRYVNKFFDYKVYIEKYYLEYTYGRLHRILNKNMNINIKPDDRKKICNLVNYLIVLRKIKDTFNNTKNSPRNKDKPINIKFNWDTITRDKSKRLSNHTIQSENDRYVLELSKPAKYEIISEWIDSINYKFNSVYLYSLKKGDVLIEIDLTEVIDCICFECMFRDLGYRDKDIESNLKIANIHILNNSDILIRSIAKDDFNCSNFGKSMYIDDTPKKDKSTNKVYNYYNMEVDNNKYKELIITNRNYTLNYICYLLFKQLTKIIVNEQDINTRVWCLFGNKVMIYTNKNELDIVLDILSSLVCRLFGRLFEFKINKTIISV